MNKNIVHYHSAMNMKEIDDNSIDLIITSPPYFNIKDYSKDGVQQQQHSSVKKQDVGSYKSFNTYLKNLNKVWEECFRVLKPNGKLCVNVPLLPVKKEVMNTHHNRHIYDLQSEIQKEILKIKNMYLLDIYIWNRTNATKKLMFGSYPNPGNLYAQNTSEFITVFVKGGKPKSKKNRDLLSKEEWVEFTKQIWDIPIPNKKDLAFGEHSAIMPEQIVLRLVRMFSDFGDTVLDPFTGSGTTLKVAKEQGRNYIGYEIYDNYKKIIDKKLMSVKKIRGDKNS